MAAPIRSTALTRRIDAEVRAQFRVLDARIEALPSYLAREVLGKASLAAAGVFAQRAKESGKFTDRTGALRASISAFPADAVFRRLGPGQSALRVRDGQAAIWAGPSPGASGARNAYAGFVERGAFYESTGHRKEPRPFLWDGIIGGSPGALAAILAVGRREFPKVVRGIERIQSARQARHAVRAIQRSTFR